MLKTYIYQPPLQIVVMWHSFGQWEANEWCSLKRCGGGDTLWLILPAWSENVMLKRQHKLRVAEGRDRKGLELWDVATGSMLRKPSLWISNYMGGNKTSKLFYAPVSQASLQLVAYCSSFYEQNWSIVDLQHCISFRCTARWFSYTYIYTYTYIYISLFSIMCYCKVLNL